VNFFVVIGLAMVMFMALVTQSEQSAIDAPETTDEARALVDQYRVFMYVADQYMKVSAPTQAGIVTVDWATMALSPVTPPATRQAPMPQGWRVVRAADMSWVACTQMDERAAGTLGQFMPLPSANGGGQVDALSVMSTPVSLSSAGGTRTFVVVGTPPATAPTLANLCNN
jgi:hypothetical protein